MSSELRGFILRTEVLHLYRRLLRTATGAGDPPARAELRGEIRRQFEAHRGQRDQATIKFLLSGGRQQLKQLGEMLGMQL